MIGTVLAERYKITKAIGSGGMQHVFSAHDILRDAEVALKFPQEGQAHKKFKNSAVIAARVNHHHVAKTLDYFEVSNTPHLIEEYAGEGTLDSCIANYGFFDPHTAARLFRMLAKGLAASHQKGVVHRDLKPSNVVVSGGYLLTSVKITDFGIATLTDQVFEEEIAKRGDISKTTSGTVKGALPYMSPEMMFRKKGESVGVEADVWSLGAMMFHLLSGVLPFGEGLIVPANVKMNNREAWPAFMTSKPAFSELSRDLQGIVESCLNVDPALRPTASDLAAATDELVYFRGAWKNGTVHNLAGKTFGFILSGGREVMFHEDSVYGPRQAKVGSKVVFTTAPGHPRERAFPVLVCP
ncbi:serine/threonine-protein kinase [Pseudotabrizicola alkalilacus]|uniref:non-specific serine/threonine protein kinase n=1 Tax=Pseudotabrizicola alkalilacus TaxID=2305252 RepID=A0A411YXY6_9RHOB|nr:serine/threonine-protein kinase [Pseudotabrizicola alkalilacus]RGP35721.1 serine/threonine protein kinase [Pseudotabrizicola alkalilacus]